MGSAGVERIPDDLDLPPAETLRFAQDLLNRGLAFNAHEVLESAWKNGPSEERMLWQGLAQLAVGITHIQRGNPKGALTLLRRASGRIGAAATPHGIDGPGLVAYASGLIAELEGGAAAESLPPQRLIPKLSGSDSGAGDERRRRPDRSDR